jgi:hypothetical protein
MCDRYLFIGILEGFNRGSHTGEGDCLLGCCVEFNSILFVWNEYLGQRLGTVKFQSQCASRLVLMQYSHTGPIYFLNDARSQITGWFLRTYAWAHAGYGDPNASCRGFRGDSPIIAGTEKERNDPQEMRGGED